MKNNDKVKSSKGYEYWATKHNLKTAADTVLVMREKGFKSITQLDEFIKESAIKRQSIQDEIKVIEKKMKNISQTMEQIHIVKSHRPIYEAYKKDTKDKIFKEDDKVELEAYKKALN